MRGAAIAFPFVWSYVIVGDTVVWAMLDQVWFNAEHDRAFNAVAFAKLFVAYPFRTFAYLLPTSAIVLYGLLSKAIAPATFRQNAVLIALLAAAINVLPYWAAPASSPRYLLPIYPFVALAMAYAVFNAGRLMADLSAKALIAIVAVAYVEVFAGFPAYEHYFRGSYDDAAQAIIARAGGLPIYSVDNTSVGLSIAADINARRAAAPPILHPPPGFASGVVLTAQPDPAIREVEMTLRAGTRCRRIANPLPAVPRRRLFPQRQAGTSAPVLTPPRTFGEIAALSPFNPGNTRAAHWQSRRVLTTFAGERMDR